MPRRRASDPAPPSRSGRWSDAGPAIRRRRRGRGFTYTDPDGRRLSDPATLDRIAALAIPPAWTDVRINPAPTGRLQAVGRDARGRKQYRYDPAYRRARERAKFDGLVRFAALLPAIRAQVRRDLRRRRPDERQVVALVVRVLDLTALRIGNDEYRRANRSFGLTTLRRRHVTVTGDRVELRFPGKGGATQEVAFRDRLVARHLRRMAAGPPGGRLFEHVDVDGRARALRSGHVNAYLRAAAGADGGGEATAKTFRTWAATVLACAALARAQTGQAGNDEPSSHTASGRRRRSSAALRAAIDEVAAHLGDTPTVARQAYVHPAVIEAEGDGSLDAAAARVRRRGRAQGRVGLSPDERLTLAVLRSATRPRPGDVV